MNFQAMWDKLGQRGRFGDDFPFVGLCIVVGVIAAVFLAVVIIDAVRQRRRLARVRMGEAEARKRAATGQRRV